MCSSQGLDIVNINPKTGNITLKYLWIPPRIMLDNGSSGKRGTEWVKSVRSLIQIRIKSKFCVYELSHYINL